MRASLIKPDREPDLVTGMGTKIWVKEMVVNTVYSRDELQLGSLVRISADSWQYYYEGNAVFFGSMLNDRLENLWQWAQIEKALEL